MKAAVLTARTERKPMPVWDADKNAVKRDIEQFRKDKDRVQRFFDSAMQLGYFLALDRARANGTITMALFEHEYRRYYDALLPHIGEAKKVVPHIRMALDRLERVCHEGRDRRRIENLSATPDVANTKDAIHVLQGWLATLFGNYLKFYGFVHGTPITEAVIRSWAADSWDILQKRRSEHSMLGNHDELFQTRLMEL
jgi:hypothetical protein